MSFEFKVVDEIPPLNFKHPLIGHESPLLIPVRELFIEPFSFFNEPYIMSRLSMSNVAIHPIHEHYKGES